MRPPDAIVFQKADENEPKQSKKKEGNFISYTNLQEVQAA
jgi:hypothetical protein